MPEDRPWRSAGPVGGSCYNPAARGRPLRRRRRVRRRNLPVPTALQAADLCRPCDPDRLAFDTTAELRPLERIIGQDRAVEAIRFGIGIDRPGFNVFAHGPPGHGKLTAVRRFLTSEAERRPAPDGWCYVYGFVDRARPTALRLPPGRATALRSEMHGVVEDLLQDLPMQFDGEAYAELRGRVSTEHEDRSEALFEALAAEVEREGLALFREADRWRLLPADGDAAMSEETFDALAEAERDRLLAAVERFQPRLEDAVRAARRHAREARRALADLDREVALSVVAPRMDEARGRFADLPQVVAFLAAVQADALDHLELFRSPPDDACDDGDGDRSPRQDDSPQVRRRVDARLRRYDVNVLVDHEVDAGAPVVTETHPTLSNLVGHVAAEESRHGVLRSDFTLVRPGALHRANGGYLVLEIEEVLKQPQSWDALKRALRGERVRLETAADDGRPGPLDPEEIPLAVKVVLVGEPFVYFQLFEQDADFPELFKVAAEFSDVMPRDAETELAYARFVSGVAAREGLMPFRREAVARVIEFSARHSEDARRLSADFLGVTDLLREADYWAGQRKAAVVAAGDVERAISARERRADRLREDLHDDLVRGVHRIDTAGSGVGCVNAMTVVQQGDFAFGMPVRVTARVRMGGGEVVDIEREVDLGGPLHSKGVLILAGFLGGRYVPDEPLAMAASLTFEQSYHQIDGDSASVAELVAILSALSDVPVRQEVAITGSVSQDGDVQAVGGVNEKIEGFFDVCRLHGLSGTQGVALPAANVEHLMLRSDVLRAVSDGTFHVFAVRHVDEAIALLTGMEAGARSDDGTYPDGTFNRKVEDRLAELAEKRRELGHPGDGDDDDPPGSESASADRRRPRRPRSEGRPLRAGGDRRKSRGESGQ